jgi:hypothetical protein
VKGVRRKKFVRVDYGLYQLPGPGVLASIPVTQRIIAALAVAPHYEMPRRHLLAALAEFGVTEAELNAGITRLRASSILVKADRASDGLVGLSKDSIAKIERNEWIRDGHSCVLWPPGGGVALYDDPSWRELPPRAHPAVGDAPPEAPRSEDPPAAEASSAGPLRQEEASAAADEVRSESWSEGDEDRERYDDTPAGRDLTAACCEIALAKGPVAIAGLEEGRGVVGDFRAAWVDCQAGRFRSAL